MRKIKFRGWERELQMMVYDTELGGWHFEYDGNPVCAVNQMINEEDYFYDLMQYTGLKDTKGVDIYEGDIVEYTDHWSGQSYINEIYWKFGSLVFDVEFEDSKRYTVPIHSIHMDDDRGYDQTIEVLGNIYEHPYLLGDNQSHSKYYSQH